MEFNTEIIDLQSVKLDMAGNLGVSGGSAAFISCA
jgi:hypothetical protein